MTRKLVVLAILGAGILSLPIANAGNPCRIFLVPGAFGGSGAGGANYFINAEEYFRDYREFFKAHGCEVKQGEFPPDATIEERALVLRDQVNRFRKGDPVVLIAHSQGGLDARFAIKTLGVRGISTLVTIGTPHEGTEVADWVLRERKKGGILYWALRGIGGYDLRMLRFSGELTKSFLVAHASRFAAVPEVRYGAARAHCRTSCYRLLTLVAWLADLPAGDGMVGSESQRFGEDLGEYDLDHLSTVGVDSDKKR